MPTMNGIELLRTAKAMEPSVKTVLVSAFDIEDELLEKCNFVDKFLQKPISISDLIDSVQTQITKVPISIYWHRPGKKKDHFPMSVQI